MNWIHGTVISGKKQDYILTNPDMRISLSSTKKVKSYIDLYNKSLPPNVGGINAVSVKIDEKGIPILRKKFPESEMILIRNPTRGTQTTTK